MPPTPSLRHPRRLTATLLTSSLPIGGLLTAPTAAAAPSAAATSAIRVNQVGYLPDGPKRATVVTTATQSLTRQLSDVSGTAVPSGATVPRGADTPSGQSVQVADFSSYRETGSGYVLAVDGSGSVPFDIRANLHDSLRSDAMAFFYHQRSGTPIDASLVGSAYARPAGHLGVAPNRGDTSVPCQATVCDYTQDVRGGWYGAGVSGYGGYGEKPSRNQHHRFWAHQLDASLPSPPAGSMAGGPNSVLQDPVGQEKLAGCAPAACYIDDIGTYSTNEVAINWNAPLAWPAAYAAERSSTGEPTGACAVTYKGGCVGARASPRRSPSRTRDRNPWTAGS